MKKLEDIPKKPFFTAPEGYFDELPLVIQTRLAAQAKKSPAGLVMKYALRVAMPLAAVVVAAVFWFRPAATIDQELDRIDAEQIAFYLDEHDSPGEDPQDGTSFTSVELEELEEAVFSQMGDGVDSGNILENIDLDHIDLDNL